MPELPTCTCVRGLPPYDRLTAIYQAAAELSGDGDLPDPVCVAGIPPFQRFSYIYEAFRVFTGDDSLPSQTCVAGESPQDQVSRIYQALALYADDANLESYECVRGMPIWQQWVEIYKALYSIAGSDELTSPLCVNTTFDILNEVFCAVSAIDGGGGATLLASFYIPEIVDSFERGMAAGYTGNGDPETFQREAAVDVLRDAHYQSGNGPFVILEDDPTECVLVAPGIPSVSPGAGQIDAASWSSIPVTVSLQKYQYQIDNNGWVDNGTSLNISNVPCASGTHILSVRAVSTSGVLGEVIESPAFDVEAGAFTFLDSVAATGTGGLTTTGAIDTSGANFLVIATYSVLPGATSFGVADSKGNTWTPLTPAGGTLSAQLFVCTSPVVGAGHTFSVTGSAIFSGIVAAAFSGTAGVLDDESGAVGTQPGSITPTEDGALMLSCWGRNDATTLTIDSGFTITDQTSYSPGVSLTVALAYKIQVIAGAENPTTNSDDGVVMAAFVPA